MRHLEIIVIFTRENEFHLYLFNYEVLLTYMLKLCNLNVILYFLF